MVTLSRGVTMMVSRIAPEKRAPLISTIWKVCPCRCIGWLIIVLLRIVISTRSPRLTGRYGYFPDSARVSDQATLSIVQAYFAMSPVRSIERWRSNRARRERLGRAQGSLQRERHDRSGERAFGGILRNCGAARCEDEGGASAVGLADGEDRVDARAGRLDADIAAVRDRDREAAAGYWCDRSPIDSEERSSERAEVDGEVRRGAAVDDPQADLRAMLDAEDFRIPNRAAVHEKGVVVDVVHVRFHRCPGGASRGLWLAQIRVDLVGVGEAEIGDLGDDLLLVAPFVCRIGDDQRPREKALFLKPLVRVQPVRSGFRQGEIVLVGLPRRQGGL